MSHLLRDLLQKNPLFSGGLTLMVIGSAAALLRRIPSQIRAFLERRVSIWVDIPDRDPAFRWVQNWLAAHPYANRARNLSLTTTWISNEPDPTVDSNPYSQHASGPASQARFMLTPGPGVHIMFYRGRILVVHRARRDLQSAGVDVVSRKPHTQIDRRQSGSSRRSCSRRRTRPRYRRLPA